MSHSPVYVSSHYTHIPHHVYVMYFPLPFFFRPLVPLLSSPHLHAIFLLSDLPLISISPPYTHIPPSCLSPLLFLSPPYLISLSHAIVPSPYDYVPSLLLWPSSCLFPFLTLASLVYAYVPFLPLCLSACSCSLVVPHVYVSFLYSYPPRFDTYAPSLYSRFPLIPMSPPYIHFPPSCLCPFLVFKFSLYINGFPSYLRPLLIILSSPRALDPFLIPMSFSHIHSFFLIKFPPYVYVLFLYSSSPLISKFLSHVYICFYTTVGS